VVSRLAVKEGDKLNVGHLILVLETAGGAAPAPVDPPADAERKASKEPAAPPKRKAPVPQPARPEPVAVAESDAGEEFVEEILHENPSAGPNARRIARDLGLDLRVIPGTGRSGQIMVADLRDYIARLRSMAARPKVVVAAEPAAPRVPAPISIDFSQWGPVTLKPLTQLRKTIASRMVESATTLPTVTQFDDADVTELDAWRKKYASAYEGRSARLTMTSFFVKAVASLLRKHPILNASLDEVAGAIVYKDYVHVGLAVDTEAGLLVPVIRDADKKDLVTLSKEIQELAQKARDRKIGLAEMQGGTFTISNQGGIGGAHFTPIINKPEVAILGLGRGGLKPVVRDGQVTPRLLGAACPDL
jgi:pyruvate dehydrogenase E2 component (dihydrolipoamide acetyltransferase)